MKCKNCRELLSIDQNDLGLKVVFSWINLLYERIDNLPIETKKEVIKGCSIAHYNVLNMDDVLKSYIGNVHGFINFLETEWKWSVNINEEEKVIYADENKSNCVCPLVNLSEIKSTLICNCSEGFAEKIFSKVLQQDVKAMVINSVLHGDKSCIYKVVWA